MVINETVSCKLPLQLDGAAAEFNLTLESKFKVLPVIWQSLLNAMLLALLKLLSIHRSLSP